MASGRSLRNRFTSHPRPDTLSFEFQVLTGQAEMPADGGLMMTNNQANKLNCEVFVGNIPPETQSPTLQVPVIAGGITCLPKFVCLLFRLVLRGHGSGISPCCVGGGNL